MTIDVGSLPDGPKPTMEQCSTLSRHVRQELAHAQTVRAVFASELYADDQFLRRFNTTLHQLTVSRLLSSLDHLQLAARSLESREELVYCQYSLIRTALTTASTALWLIHGGLTQRRLRALNLAFFDLDQQVKFARCLVDAKNRRDPRNNRLKREAKSLVASAPARFAAIHREYKETAGTTIDPRNLRKFNETDVVIEVGRYVCTKGLISNESELLLQYRMMSGFVHGLVWSTYSGAKVRNFQGDKSAMVELKGNSSNIYNGATTVLIVARAAKARLVELGDHRDDE